MSNVKHFDRWLREEGWLSQKCHADATSIWKRFTRSHCGTYIEPEDQEHVDGEHLQFPAAVRISFQVVRLDTCVSGK